MEHGSSMSVDGLSSSRLLRFSLRDLRSWTNDFDASCRIGKGSSASVYHAVDASGTSYAVKVVQSRGENAQRQFENEVNALVQFRHPNIVPLIGYYFEDNQSGLVYELLQRGNLIACLADDVSTPLSWEDRVRIAVGVARGLHFLHNARSQPCFHRDVKSANIGLSDQCAAKLLDCGLAFFGGKGEAAEGGDSTVAGGGGQPDGKGDNAQAAGGVSQAGRQGSIDGSFTVTDFGTAGPVGTPGYMCPRYAAPPYKYGVKSEVYSYGVVLLELLTGRKAVGNGGRALVSDVEDWVGQGHAVEDWADKRPGVGEWPGHVKKVFSQLIMKCIAVGPQYHGRPSFGAILEALNPLYDELEAELVSTCCICLEQKPSAQGVTCGGQGRHFCCNLCFSKHVQSQSSSEVDQLRARNADVLCPCAGHGCESAEFSSHTIAGSVSTEVFQSYMTSKCKVAEVDAVDAAYRDMIRSSEGSSVVESKQTELLEMLCLHCPRCHSVFADYDACDAVKCSRCGTGFCALCLQDCGADAHNHVAWSCPEKDPNGTVYGGHDNFKAVHAARRQRDVEVFLRIIQDVDLRRRVLEASAPYLSAIDLDMDDLRRKVLPALPPPNSEELVERLGDPASRMEAVVGLYNMCGVPEFWGGLKASGVAAELVGVLAGSDVQCRALAALALGRLATVTDGSYREVLACSAVVPLVGLLNDGDAACRANVAWALGEVARAGREGAHAVVGAGGLLPLVACLKDSALEACPAYAASALGGIAHHHYDSCAVMCQEGAVATLVGLLSSTYAASRTNAAWTLGEMSAGEDPSSAAITADIVEAGGIQALVHILNQGAPLPPAGGYCDGDEVAQGGRDSPTLDAAAPLSEEAMHARFAAGRAVAELARHRGERRGLVVHAGGLPVLVSLLTNELCSWTIRRPVAKLVALVACDSNSNEHHKDIVRAGGIPALVQLLGGSDPECRAHAALALKHIGQHSSEYCAAIGSVGGAIPRLVGLLGDNEYNYRYTAAAFDTIVLACEENRKAIADRGGIPGLVALLRDTSRARRNHALSALQTIAETSKKNSAAIVQVGGIPAVVGQLKEGCQDAAAVLGNIAERHSESCTAIGEAGAVPALMDVLGDSSSGHLGDAAVALVLIAENSPEYRAAIMQSGYSMDDLHRIIRGSHAKSKMPRRAEHPPPPWDTSHHAPRQ